MSFFSYWSQIYFFSKRIKCCQRERKKKKTRSTFLCYKLYKNLSLFMLQVQSSIQCFFFNVPLKNQLYQLICIEERAPFTQLVLMSRRDYRISICFSDKAVTSLVSHWNSINLVYQGPMWKSKLHLTLYQLSITYTWTLPVSTQQVMILLSIRQLANSNNNNKRQNRRQKPGRLETTCLAGSEDVVFVSVFIPIQCR